MSNPLDNLKSLLIEEPWSDELPEEWDVIESGDWTDCHKAESKDDIIKHLPTGRFFKASFYRIGDHWKGHETEFSGAVEVEPYESVVVLYRPVKPLAATVPAMSKAKEVKE